MSEQIRLLACSTCKTIEDFPDYTGPQERAEDYDHLLNTLLSRHRTAGHPHIGQLFKVDKAKWADSNVRQDVTKQISDKLGGGETGLGSPFYNLKSTFQEDAMACWKAHNRTTNCDEFKSERKLLKPDTAAERRDAGVGEYRSDIHLCNFCPMASLVEQAVRQKMLKSRGE